MKRIEDFTKEDFAKKARIEKYLNSEIGNKYKYQNSVVATAKIAGGLNTNWLKNFLLGQIYEDKFLSYGEGLALFNKYIDEFNLD